VHASCVRLVLKRVFLRSGLCNYIKVGIFPVRC
jgi:hypothetical protein